ncbi:MAG: alpha/beta hydrolase, partial [Gammaproteobacteria bacterium]
DKNFKTGKEFQAFWQRIWNAITERYAESSGEQLQLTPEALFEAYKEQNPSDKDLEALIATAFRISAASMMVTADVMSQSGYIVPKGSTAKVTADVTDYFVVSHRTGFMEYARELMLPYYQDRDSSITFEELERRASLYPLENYLRNSKKIGLIHNEDDIIMAPGELNWLKNVFEDRSKIYPRGGHLGNVAYTDNINYMIEFFKN